MRTDTIEVEVGTIKVTVDYVYTRGEKRTFDYEGCPDEFDTHRVYLADTERYICAPDRVIFSLLLRYLSESDAKKTIDDLRNFRGIDLRRIVDQEQIETKLAEIIERGDV